MKKVILVSIVCFAILFDRVDSAPLGGSSSKFNGAYCGLGISGSFLKNNFDAHANTAVSSAKEQSLNRISGTLILGGGQIFQNKYYVGGEGLIDLSTSNKNDIEWKDGGSTPAWQGQERGIVQTMALRLGYVNNCLLFYLKPAILSFPEFVVLARNTSQELCRDHKFVYSMGLGVEKIFCREFSARVEVGYSFRSQNNGVNSGTHTVNFRNHGGFGFRILFAYYI